MVRDVVLEAACLNTEVFRDVVLQTASLNSLGVCLVTSTSVQGRRFGGGVPEHLRCFGGSVLGYRSEVGGAKLRPPSGTTWWQVAGCSGTSFAGDQS